MKTYIVFLGMREDWDVAVGKSNGKMETAYLKADFVEYGDGLYTFKVSPPVSEGSPRVEEIVAQFSVASVLGWKYHATTGADPQL